MGGEGRALEDDGDDGNRAAGEEGTGDGGEGAELMVRFESFARTLIGAPIVAPGVPEDDPTPFGVVVPPTILDTALDRRRLR